MSEQIIKPKIVRPYKICTCCVMDTTDENITFDENGVCMRCKEYKMRIEPEWNRGKGHEKELSDLIKAIKKSGEGKKYDCILGLSGGLDSSYLLHLAVTEWGLRPYVFHIDCGWDLPVAENNIKKLTDRMGVKLHVKHMNWNEMREMQLAWFRTGLEALDAPQDHAFISLIDELAIRLDVKFILNGYNIATEAVADPASWGQGAGPTGDGTYIKDVIRKKCTIPIKEYVFTNGFRHKVFIPYIKRVRTITPLNYVPITREKMIDTLKNQYEYEQYGQKHFENLLTKFIEGFWNPTRFGHDIRRVWLSALVITGQMKREDALAELEKPPLKKEESLALIKAVANKLNISEEELMHYHDMPACEIRFKSRSLLYRIGIKTFEILGLEKRIRK